VLAERIALAARSLPAELAGPRARASLERLAVRAPPLGEPFGFECRLAPGDLPIDLGIGIDRGHADSLGEWAATRGASWGPLVSFLRRWSQDPLLATWIPFLFLEFDADAAEKPESPPSIFLALDSPLARPQSAETAPEVRAALHAVSSLRGRSDEVLEDGLRRAYEALPADARLLHAGAMLGRRTDRLRVSVSIDPEAATDYLIELGGSAAAEGLCEVVEALAGRCASVQLDFDAGPEPGPRCGIGLRTGRSDAAGQAPLFDDIDHSGWACARKTSALRSWSAGGSAATPGHRRLSHLKLVCEPGRRPEVKAYLEVS
jgi:hypothetical protein